MSLELIDRSADLKRIVDEGYTLEIRAGYALIHDIPYVNANVEIGIGTMVCAITLAGDIAVCPGDHIMYFAGDHPCNADGSIITGIAHNSGYQDFGDGIVVNHSFSNKPKEGFGNYYDKFMSYINIITAPVHLLDNNITAQLHKPIQTSDDSVFHYRDTNTSRANIGTITDKLKDKSIGIVGIGGTGSYILDMVAKTTVSEIHLFDGDQFLSHNAFRAPGAPSIKELEKTSYKVDYFLNIYSNMRKGIIGHSIFVGSNGLDCLTNLDFLFICIDSGADKKAIIDSLVAASIPFIDTGIGINTNNDMLCGATRVTVVNSKTNESWRQRVSSDDDRDDLYSSNIQIAEINALCAILAVIKWKKYYGVYFDQEPNDFTAFDIGMGEIVNEN